MADDDKPDIDPEVKVKGWVKEAIDASLAEFAEKNKPAPRKTTPPENNWIQNLFGIQ